MAARAYLHQTARRLARLHHPLLNRQSLHARAPFLQSRCNPLPQNFKPQTSKPQPQTPHRKSQTHSQPQHQMVPATDAEGNPLLDPNGLPILVASPLPPKRPRPPPKLLPVLDADGQPVQSPTLQKLQTTQHTHKLRATNHQPATAGVGRLWCTPHGPGEKEAPERRQRT